MIPKQISLAEWHLESMSGLAQVENHHSETPLPGQWESLPQMILALNAPFKDFMNHPVDGLSAAGPPSEGGQTIQLKVAFPAYLQRLAVNNITKESRHGWLTGQNLSSLMSPAPGPATQQTSWSLSGIMGTVLANTLTLLHWMDTEMSLPALTHMLSAKLPWTIYLTKEMPFHSNVGHSKGKGENISDIPPNPE